MNVLGKVLYLHLIFGFHFSVSTELYVGIVSNVAYCCTCIWQMAYIFYFKLLCLVTDDTLKWQKLKVFQGTACCCTLGHPKLCHGTEFKRGVK